MQGSAAVETKRACNQRYVAATQLLAIELWRERLPPEHDRSLSHIHHFYVKLTSLSSMLKVRPHVSSCCQCGCEMSMCA